MRARSRARGHYPSVVQRGALQNRHLDGWAEPSLAQRLRKQLEDQFGAEYEEWLAQLGEARDKLHSAKLDPEERKRLLHEDASEEAFEASCEPAANRNAPLEVLLRPYQANSNL